MSLARAILATLPDPREPSIVPLGFVLGAIAGGTVARLRRRPSEHVTVDTATGAWFGGLLALIGLPDAGAGGRMIGRVVRRWHLVPLGVAMTIILPTIVLVKVFGWSPQVITAVMVVAIVVGVVLIDLRGEYGDDIDRRAG